MREFSIILLSNWENREHVKIFRNVDCLVTNRHEVQDTWANLTGVRGFKVFFFFKGLYNWNRKSDLKQTKFCIYWFLTELLNEILEAEGRAYNQDGHFFLFSCLLLTIWMPRTGYHKLFSCTFLSGTTKCRVIYALYRLYALEDPLKKYTFEYHTTQKHFLE